MDLRGSPGAPSKVAMTTIPWHRSDSRLCNMAQLPCLIRGANSGSHHATQLPRGVVLGITVAHGGRLPRRASVEGGALRERSTWRVIPLL